MAVSGMPRNRKRTIIHGVGRVNSDEACTVVFRGTLDETLMILVRAKTGKRAQAVMEVIVDEDEGVQGVDVVAVQVLVVLERTQRLLLRNLEALA